MADRLSAALEALQRPLRFAAKDGFGRIDDVQDLGRTLAGAAARLAELSGPEHKTRLTDYAAQLRRFDEGGRSDRVRLVALGLRLCAEQRPKASPAAGSVPTVGEGLDAPLTIFKGVGPRVAQRLAQRGLRSVGDLLFFLPLGYRDQRKLEPLERLPAGEEVNTEGVVSKLRRRRARGRPMLELGLAGEEDGPPLLWCIWFGKVVGGLSTRLAVGQRLRVSGRTRRYRDALQIAHPDFGPAETEGTVRPRYPEVEQVAPRLVERICAEACRRFADEVIDGIPARLARLQQLPSQTEALHQLHLVDYEPDAAALAQLEAGTHPAQRRLAFEELLTLQLTIAERRRAWGERNAQSCRPAAETRRELEGLFPFRLTAAQQQVIDEILADMRRARPMHRLLQGDVGSGKTVVAFVAAMAAVDSGLQAALMAPTEVLAEQHLAVLGPWCERMGRRAALLTASTPRPVRETLLALADAGELHLLLGTHALLAERVQLPNLGLAIVDEQHRFGVLQRARLRERGDAAAMPHLLVMTATPIPRTMALTLYGDLDISVLGERPPGRLPVQTQVFDHGRLERGTPAFALVEQRLAAGGRVFVIAPLVEESERLAVADATSTAERLRAQLPGVGVGLVHGRMPAAERASAIEGFRRGGVGLLVATTVIEVGIDVPEATMMVVEHAERFGLAQLHQLRGRVGRAPAVQAYCLLLSGSGSETPAAARLEVLARSDDGFEIAEADLSQRGPGELWGTRQAGLPRLIFADPRRQLTLLGEAQRAARELLERDPDLCQPEHAGAREAMRRRWGERPLPGVEAG